jgi:hypothetical protein
MRFGATTTEMHKSPFFLYFQFFDLTGTIHINQWEEHDPKRTGSVVYLYVSDADAVRAEWASCGVEGRLGEARNTEYGMREFSFVDSDGTLHRVGSKLR